MNCTVNKENIPYHIVTLTGQQLLSVYGELAPQHFPADELKTVGVIETLLSRGAYEGLGLFDCGTAGEPGKLLSYALFLKPPGASAVLLDYYAVLQEYRSLGLGSVFLEGMKQCFPGAEGILLETEDPDAASCGEERSLRCRRNGFYVRGGARVTGVRCTLFRVPFRILYLPISRQLTDGQVQARLDAVYRFMLPEPLYSQNVEWN